VLGAEAAELAQGLTWTAVAIGQATPLSTTSMVK
jgi:hypothetical protein